MTPRHWIPATLIAALLSAGPALAQTAAKDEPVAKFGDWAVFVAGSPKECYLGTLPTSSSAKRGGKTVTVERGDIRLYVTYRPADSVVNEISFKSGYPLKAGSTVKMAVGSKIYNLNPGTGDSSGWAWPASPSEDGAVVAALRKGAKATVTALSARGTTTSDVFSLIGITAALGDAEARCR